MTPALRKYHRAFWLGAMVVLPILFIAAIAAIPGRISDPIDREMQPDALSVVNQEKQLEQFIIRLRTNTGGDLYQLELVITEPLEVPEALVYLGPGTLNDLDAATFLGKLSSVGTYRFMIPAELVQEGFSLKIYNPFDNAHLIEATL